LTIGADFDFQGRGMKTIIILILFVYIHYSFGQMVTAKNGVIVVTNLLTQEQAVKAASGLSVGMREEDATWFLATNKLYSTVSTGPFAYYTLSNGCNLVLAYRGGGIVTNGLLDGEGRLQKAFIQRNGVDIISIALTNAP
jgi:hypothetical protein